jgi:dynein heavy chain
MQANIWLKNKYRENAKETSEGISKGYEQIKPTMDSKQMNRLLKNCIQYGTPVIFEDANETFDPNLDSILSKQIEKKGNDLLIKLGDEVITFHEEFKFYVTTKMPSPHYSPEICVKVTILNF